MVRLIIIIALLIFGDLSYGQPILHQFDLLVGDTLEGKVVDDNGNSYEFFSRSHRLLMRPGFNFQEVRINRGGERILLIEDSKPSSESESEEKNVSIDKAVEANEEDLEAESYDEYSQWLHKEVDEKYPNSNYQSVTEDSSDDIEPPNEEPSFWATTWNDWANDWQEYVDQLPKTPSRTLRLGGGVGAYQLSGKAGFGEIDISSTTQFLTIDGRWVWGDDPYCILTGQYRTSELALKTTKETKVSNTPEDEVESSYDWNTAELGVGFVIYSVDSLYFTAGLGLLDTSLIQPYVENPATGESGLKSISTTNPTLQVGFHRITTESLRYGGNFSILPVDIGSTLSTYLGLTWNVYTEYVWQKHWLGFAQLTSLSHQATSDANCPETEASCEENADFIQSEYILNFGVGLTW